MKYLIATLALCFLSACPKDAEQPTAAASTKRMPPPLLKPPEASPGSPSRTEDVPVRMLSEPDSAPVCTVGQPMACACPGSKTQGTRTCLSPDGTLSECGCLPRKKPVPGHTTVVRRTKNVAARPISYLEGSASPAAELREKRTQPAATSFRTFWICMGAAGRMANAA